MTSAARRLSARPLRQAVGLRAGQVSNLSCSVGFTPRSHVNDADHPLAETAWTTVSTRPAAVSRRQNLPAHRVNRLADWAGQGG